MTRVLLSTWGSRGDVEPMTAFAVELKKLGVEARICAPPDFADLAERAGVALIPLGDSLRNLLHGDKPLTPADAPRTAARLVDLQFDIVGEAAKGCDAVVASGLMPAGLRTIAEVLDVPYVLVALHPCPIPSPHHSPLPRPGKPFPPGADNQTMWQVDAERVQALYGEPLNAHRAALGLPPVANVRDHVFTARPWLAADPILAPWPGSPDFAVARTGAWILPDRRPLPTDLAEFLESGAPAAYVSMGSVRAPDDVARVAIDAVRAQGMRVVVGRGWADLALIDDRDDCFAVGEVNHQALFRCVAPVVHHGGAGTTTTATAAGVPQVVVPQFADQPYFARRVADLGIGAAHDGPTPTADSLSAALATALTPDIRARAEAMAGRIRTDGASVAAERLVAQITARRAAREMPASR
ncbi:glycosyltransferase [Mycobacterium sp. ITM-2016-00318]|uniref:glycosyltransferase n=1 Tax=Mycobacterium sp. ITM-2016-00318 TaxID=2099693 RepID=UPI000CF9CC10|nr:glycosyltransferase [Mycobacterium sp. ITM-2016-00318]WNG93312.1 glycosyltransferase [Mycobacterium sp. ITM-2016-00318]